jgi:hypothetical protein
MIPMEMSEVKNGMRVRHITSGEILTVVSTPFWFDGEPTVTLQDKRSQARMTAPLRQLINCFSGHWEDTQPPVLYGKHEMLAALEAVGFQKVTWRAADMRVGVTIGWKKPAWQEMLEA